MEWRQPLAHMEYRKGTWNPSSFSIDGSIQSLSRRNGVGTVDQTGLAPDFLLVFVLALVPRGQASGKTTNSLALLTLSELQFPGTPTQLACGLCVRLAQCLLGNVVEVFSA